MASSGLNVPDEYYEGDWYHYGDNFVTRGVEKGNGFVILLGFIVDRVTDDQTDSLDLVVTSMKEYQLQ